MCMRRNWRYTICMTNAYWAWRLWCIQYTNYIQWTVNVTVSIHSDCVSFMRFVLTPVVNSTGSHDQSYMGFLFSFTTPRNRRVIHVTGDCWLCSVETWTWEGTEKEWIFDLMVFSTHHIRFEIKSRRFAMGTWWEENVVNKYSEFATC